MNISTLSNDLEDELKKTPVIDIHTHLVGGKLGAQGLQDLLLYHMGVSDLYAAGCPDGKRLTEYPDWPTPQEAEERIVRALPYVRYVQNTSTAWAMRIVLQDLYGWSEPITENNWREIHSLIAERANDRTWHHAIFDRLNIKKTGTELARRELGQDDDRFQYALEWAFFTRSQWGEYDTALYELERCWGKSFGTASSIGAAGRQPTERVIRTLEDVKAAVEHYVQHIPFGQITATATHISTDINLRPVSDDEMTSALARRPVAGLKERDVYASYINEAFLTALEPFSDNIVFQFSYGAEPLPYETGSRLSQESIKYVAEMITRHPGIRFQCFLASRHANQSLCSLARELPNLSLAGYWWHNFFPESIRQVLSERLDMLPVNKQVGFFSDAYCIEWVYGKLVLVRKILSQVLAERVIQGQYSINDSLTVAREILFQSPQTLLGMVPRQ